MHDLNRRRFLTVAGTSAVAAIASQPLFGLETALGAPLTRLDVGGLSSSSPTIKSYIKAVAAMKALPDSDPTSWTYQAAIHETTATSLKKSWNSCQHGNEFFWSWHRMYLHWFERIIRSKSGDHTWALPFWAWDSPSERHLPPMFRDSTSTLYRADRDPNMNNGTGSLPAWAVDYSGAFGTPVYTTTTQTGANDLFQITPHGAVHVQVGGGMAIPATAAPDPIFYLHHANCDRLWQVWRATYGGSDPVWDSTWTGKTWTFFNEHGKAVTMSACQIINAAQQLNYVYEGVPAPAKETCPARLVCCIPVRQVFPLNLPPIPPFGAEVVRFPLPIPPELRQRLTNMAPDQTQNIYLQLQGVEAATQPGAVWLAFLGPSAAAPAAMMAASAAAENKDQRYIGNVLLFGLGVRDEMASMNRPATFALRLNRALLASSGTAPLALTFVPQGVLIDGRPSRPQVRSTVHVGKIRILVETIRRQ
jgi:hypothetical protein